MGELLDLFKKTFRLGPKDPDTENDRREFQRFDMSELPVYVTIEGCSRKFNVVNLSYGGVLVVLPEKELAEFVQPDGLINGTVYCYHLKEAFTASLQYTRTDLAGLMFMHRYLGSLVFLRNILEFIRLGYSLARPLATADSRDQTVEVEHYIGDLGANFHITYGIGHSIDRLDLAFRDGDITCKVEYLDRHLIYRRFDSEAGDSFLALQAGLFIILGMIQYTKAADGKGVSLTSLRELKKIFLNEIKDQVGVVSESA